MSLLTIIQNACTEIGIDSPSLVVTNTDKNILQMYQLANRAGKFLAQRFCWEELTQEAIITTLAQEDQGFVDTLMPGFNWLLYKTQWNRDFRMGVYGALYPSEWQFLKASNITGPFPNFRIRGKKLLYLPAPTAGQEIGLEYVSKYWCKSSGGTAKAAFTEDDDVGVIDEELITLQLKWLFKSAKGLDYIEDQRIAESVTENAISRSNSPRTLSMSKRGTKMPGDAGLLIPDGNWMA